MHLNCYTEIDHPLIWRFQESKQTSEFARLHRLCTRSTSCTCTRQLQQEPHRTANLFLWGRQGQGVLLLRHQNPLQDPHFRVQHPHRAARPSEGESNSGWTFAASLDCSRARVFVKLSIGLFGSSDKSWIYKFNIKSLTLFGHAMLQSLHVHFGNHSVTGQWILFHI